MNIKQKRKLKPTPNFGTKFEKRKKKKEKLLVELGKKKEAQQLSMIQQAPQPDVSFDENFVKMLIDINNAPIEISPGKTVTPNQMKQNVIREMKQINQNGELFNNPGFVLQQIHQHLDAKASLVQQQQQQQQKQQQKQQNQS
ncbi:TolA [Histomonas meleagridis]|uniref:TolA n=1 Tax=Histomonas meleagridis TaxID=135588 RepID=UPI0035595FAE|nr:TolA [Histomonas meleagridis]KAH0804996.1 TolA [Histomonas meleagridis]